MDKSEALIELAHSQGVSSIAVKDILELIDPHPDLIELPRMVVGLMQAFDAAGRSPEVSLRGGDARVRSEACEWIISLAHLPGVTDVLGERFKPAEYKNNVNPIKHRGE